MKLFLKKVVKVKARNILGKPVEVEEWYHIYKWTLRGRRYLSLGIMPNSAMVYTKIYKALPTTKMSFRWLNYKPISRFTLEEAKFIIQDITNNPHRYISYEC